MGLSCCSCSVTKSEDIKTVEVPEPEPTPQKWCYRCRRWLLVTEFYKNNKTKDGLTWECRECDKARQARYKERKEN